MGSLYAADLIQIARDWLNYEEGPNNWNIFADVLDKCGYFAPQESKQSIPWCAIFCDFCALQAAIPQDRDNEAKKYDAQFFLYQPSYNNYSASALIMAGYFKNAGAWYTTDPKPGDLVFFQSGGEIVHVGIVEEVSENMLTTIEGNAGDCVQRKWYDLPCDRIAGYGRPQYDGDQQPQTPPESSKDTKQEILDYLSDLDCIINKIRAIL